jgi:hypothetical protein
VPEERDVWVVKGKLEPVPPTLATTVTVSGVQMTVRGSDIVLMFPTGDMPHEDAMQKGFGQARLFASNLAYDVGKPLTLRVVDCYHVDANGNPTYWRYVSDEAHADDAVQVAAAGDRQVDSLQASPPVSGRTLRLVGHKALEFALYYYNKGLLLGESEEALPQFYQAVEAIKKTGVGRLGFTKKQWDLVTGQAQPFRHAPEPDSPALPSVSADVVHAARVQTKAIIDAYVSHLEQEQQNPAAPATS